MPCAWQHARPGPHGAQLCAAEAAACLPPPLTHIGTATYAARTATHSHWNRHSSSKGCVARAATHVRAIQVLFVTCYVHSGGLPHLHSLTLPLPPHPSPVPPVPASFLPASSPFLSHAPLCALHAEHASCMPPSREPSSTPPCPCDPSPPSSCPLQLYAALPEVQQRTTTLSLHPPSSSCCADRLHAVLPGAQQPVPGAA